MPILVKRNPNSGSLPEYMMLEIQGDLQNRNEDIKDVSGAFVGDIFFNQFGHPILIIGHHILFGMEKKLEKPFAVIEKVLRTNQDDENHEDKDSQQSTNNITLDSTINIENRTEVQVEYQVRALIKKKIVFNQRPRPIISEC